MGKSFASQMAEMGLIPAMQMVPWSPLEVSFEHKARRLWAPLILSPTEYNKKVQFISGGEMMIITSTKKSKQDIFKLFRGESFWAMHG